MVEPRVAEFAEPTPEQAAAQEAERQAFLASPEGQRQLRRQELVRARQECSGEGIQAAAAERWPALCREVAGDKLLAFSKCLRECGQGADVADFLKDSHTPAYRALFLAMHGYEDEMRQIVDQMTADDQELLQGLLDDVLKATAAEPTK